MTIRRLVGVLVVATLIAYALLVAALLLTHPTTLGLH